MMIISHRGNLDGPAPATENREETIVAAFSHGFDCEIDVWKCDGRLWLGHDGPDTETSLEFLERHESRLWVHCKNLDALIALKNGFNCFFHDKDTYTLTSRGHIWGNIGSPMTVHTIQVMPERTGWTLSECWGVCTDYPIRYSKSG
jgi:hypothetical protein